MTRVPKADGSIELTCPRCGGIADEYRSGVPGFPRPGAVSRFDNMTMICTDCGQDEAMSQFKMAAHGLAAKAVHPIDGVVVWVRPPAGMSRGFGLGRETGGGR